MPIRFRLLAVALALFVFPAVSTKAQTEQFLANAYFSGPKEVTIASRDGQVLSVINVPVGVMLSVHLVHGEFDGPQGKSGVPYTFRGDVHIRTQTHAGESGALMKLMSTAPFRLDVQNVSVTIAPKK